MAERRFGPKLDGSARLEAQHLVLVGHNRLGRRLACCANNLGWNVTVLSHEHGRYRDPCGTCERLTLQQIDVWSPDVIGGVLRRDGVAPTVWYSTIDRRIALAHELASQLGGACQTRNPPYWAADKLQLAVQLEGCGIRMPRTEPATTLEDALQAATAIGWPVVIKPRDMNGSRHVRLCVDERTLREAWYLHAADLTDLKHGLKGLVDMVIQEYVPGPLFSVETLTTDETLVIGITDRVLSELPHFAEVGGGFPADLPSGIADELAAIAIDAVGTLGMVGPSHVELVVASDGPVLIELNARPAGGPVNELIRAVTGIDMLEATLVALAERQLPQEVILEGAAAAAEFPVTGSGILKSVEGIDRLRGRPEIVAVEWVGRVGQHVGNRRDNRDDLGWAMAHAATLSAARAVLDAAVHDDVQIVLDAS